MSAEKWLDLVGGAATLNLGYGLIVYISYTSQKTLDAKKAEDVPWESGFDVRFQNVRMAQLFTDRDDAKRAGVELAKLVLRDALSKLENNENHEKD